VEANSDGGCVLRQRCEEAIIVPAATAEALAVGGECHPRYDDEVDMGWVHQARQIPRWLV
jgi:hypothetical protein